MATDLIADTGFEVAEVLPGRAVFSLGAGRLEVGTRHPMAQKLRALGLPKRPLLSVWAGHLEFTMSAPRRLG